MKRRFTRGGCPSYGVLPEEWRLIEPPFSEYRGESFSPGGDINIFSLYIHAPDLSLDNGYRAAISLGTSSSKQLISGFSGKHNGVDYSFLECRKSEWATYKPTGQDREYPLYRIEPRKTIKGYALPSADAKVFQTITFTLSTSHFWIDRDFSAEIKTSGKVVTISGESEKDTKDSSTQPPLITIKSDSKFSYQELVNLAGVIREFETFLCGQESEFVTTRIGEEKDAPAPYELWMTHQTEKKEDCAQNYPIFRSSDVDIEIEEVLQKWFTLTEPKHEALRMLLSMNRGIADYLQNEAILKSILLEALHKFLIPTDNKKLTYQSRVKELYEGLSQELKNILLSNVEEWLGIITRTRNSLIHEANIDVDLYDYFDHIHIAYVVGELCVAERIGIPTNILESFAQKRARLTAQGH